MLRKIALSVLLTFVASSAAFADEQANDDALAACERQCTENEEACYERCPDGDEGEACADACYSAADACFNACDQR